MAGCLKIESAKKLSSMVAPAIGRANHLRDSPERRKSQSGIPHHQPEPRVSQRCESWHHSFGDATVISCRSPELDPVADGGVFLAVVPDRIPCSDRGTGGKPAGRKRAISGEHRS
jgi:hypothetical protein